MSGVQAAGYFRVEMVMTILVTIREVARAAGVSITTVSRALNGYGDVGEDTRQRVIEIAARMNYRPSNVARSLVTKRTKTIGLLVSGIMSRAGGHHFVFEVMRGLNDRLGDFGYDLLFVSTSAAEQQRVSYLDFCTQRRFDGVILTGLRLDDPYMNEVIESPLPCVSIDLRTLSDHCGYVMTNNTKGARLAVEHLVQAGHRVIGFVNGDSGQVSKDRLAGYHQALREAGIAYEETLVEEADFSVCGGAVGLAALKTRRPDLTAVFFASDLMAIGGIQQARVNGWSIPSDLSIVGFDDIDLANFVVPSLTTVHQPRYDMGTTAAEMLVGMMERGERPDGRLLPPKLMVRESSSVVYMSPAP